MAAKQPWQLGTFAEVSTSQSGSLSEEALVSPGPDEGPEKNLHYRIREYVRELNVPFNYVN